MKITMSTTFRLLALTLAAITFATGQARATEVLVNGDFASGLAPWYVEDGIDPSWDPLDSSQGAASLHPLSTEGYMGPVLIQPVNVTDIAGQQATATVDLWVVNGDLTSDAPMVAMKIEFLDSSGQIHEETVLQSSLKEIGQSDAANPSHQQASPYTFPSDAVRLVEVSLVKLGYGEVMADNVSLDIANATVGPVPLITGISPTSVAYGDTVTITGTNFGTTQGQVLINGRTDGITVKTWSDEQITVQVDPPAVPGTLVVRQDTESNPSQELGITSPFFFITSADIPDRMRVLAGTTIRLPLGVGFANGYTLPANGSITWSLADLNGNTLPTYHFAPATLNGPGGTVLTVDTSSMTPGLHRFEVQASDGTTTQVGKGEVEIWKIGRIEFFNEQTGDTITSLTVDRQGEFGDNIGLRIFDTADNPVPESDILIPTAIQSDNPAVVLAHQMPDDVTLYAVGSGQATVTVTFADGFQAQLPVNVDLPTAPRVTVTLNPSSITNKQSDPITFTATGADALTNAGLMEYSFLNLQEDAQNCGYADNNTTYSCTYTVDLNTPYSFPSPWFSSAVFHATATSGTATATGYAILTVTNDSSYAAMEGTVASLDPQLSPYSLENGTFEFYDPTDTSQPSFSRQLIGTPNRFGFYRLAGVEPGTYLVRYITPAGMAQWYPGSPDADNAQPVTFTAGQWTKDINFLFMGQPEGEPDGTGDGTGTAPEGDVILTPDTVEGPAPLTVNFTCAPDSTSGITMGTADFDFNRDGIYDETGNTSGSASHVYDTPGTYDVVCRITDANTGTTTESNPKTITVTDSTGGTGEWEINKWDCNGNGVVDLPDILCQLRLLAAEQQSQP